ncbi:hypothetical protein [Chitinophaga sp. CF418]|uniref:hypothetical protein n=1 Tax=Chitinophaga sp. CF418 TaxID=1855287 RepID=UPI000911B0D4|nr:hypothetical protein [Chitinophaga sp. CF418]SHN43131.1 hypothetical protein SAMN05216311_115153 [Chitinophaga sp. CF418]
MRTMLRVTMDVIASNKAIKDGTLSEIINSTMDRTHPEATYFTAIDGCRACIMVFDLHDPSDIPSIAEPFFVNLNAKVEFSPVMNAEDLKKGLEISAKSFAMA